MEPLICYVVCPIFARSVTNYLLRIDRWMICSKCYEIVHCSKLPSILERSQPAVTMQKTTPMPNLTTH